MQTDRVIVSCGICGQPFDAVRPTARAVAMGVPQHEMLGPRGEPPSGVCQGSGLPPMTYASMTHWEVRWRRLFDDAPFPAILAGDGVQFV